MKNLNTLLIAIFFSSILVSCYKDAYKVDPNFVGFWTDNEDKYNFEIVDSDGNSAFWDDQDEKIVDNIKVSNTKLKIGNRKFVINQFPQLDSIGLINQVQYEYFSMKLDGIVLIKKKIKY